MNIFKISLFAFILTFAGIAAQANLGEEEFEQETEFEEQEYVQTALVTDTNHMLATRICMNNVGYENMKARDPAAMLEFIRCMAQYGHR